MAFKCYCHKCETPLYFEEDVPMPQICKSCLTGQVECDYPNCACPRYGRCPKLSALPPSVRADVDIVDASQSFQNPIK